MKRRSREERFPNTSTFTYYNANPKNRITSDCNLRAIATATGKKWEDVLIESAYLSCENGYDPADTKGIEKYLASIGWAKHKQPRKSDGTKYTGEEFCKVQQGKKKADDIKIASRIIANIGGHHIVAIVDGKVLDIWDSTGGCIGNYWTKE